MKKTKKVICSFVMFLLYFFVGHSYSIEIRAEEKEQRPQWSEKYWETFGGRFLSPFTRSEAYPIWAVGSVATALLIITRKEGTDRFQEEIGADKPLGKTSRFFDYMGRMIPNGLYTASMVLHGGITSNSLSWYRALYMTEATLFAGLIANIIKPIVRHKRPGTSQSKMSFPSGHTTVAFAFAGAIMMEHPGPSYVVPALALASLVGISRMNDNSHHLHDVLAGGTLGLGVAVAMHYFNKAVGFRPEEEHNASSFPEDQERKNQKGRWILGASPTKDLAGGQLSALFVF